MVITMTTEELCGLLDVKKETLKSINKRNNLEKRLLACGYKLINKYKSGRDNIYEIELIKDISWEYIQAKYNVMNPEKQDKYTELRLSSTGLNLSRTSAIKYSKTNIAYNTAKKYDNILVTENIMEENKEVYFMYNLKTHKMKEIDYQEYKTFWIYNKELKLRIDDLKRRRSKYEISEETYDILLYATYEEFGVSEDSIAVKFITYKEKELANEILKQIKCKSKKVDIC